MSNLLDALWVEKYRPKSIHEVALPKTLQNNVKEWLNKKQIPHLLFYGPPGSGKTTTALILTEALTDEADRLIINGSYYRGINEVRDQILPFVRQQPISYNSAIRIVLIDEADSITGDAWKALRHIIEAYCKYARFIMTCNYITKIPDPIQSRFQCYEFKEYDKNACMSIIESILTVENVQYSPEQIALVVDRLYPDLRKIINAVQSVTVSKNGTRFLDTSKLHEAIPAEDKILSYIREFLEGKLPKRDFLRNVESIIKTQWIDYSGLYPAIFDMIPFSQLNIKVLCNKYAYQHTNCISQDMNFLAFILELSNCINAGWNIQ